MLLSQYLTVNIGILNCCCFWLPVPILLAVNVKGGLKERLPETKLGTRKFLILKTQLSNRQPESRNGKS